MKGARYIVLTAICAGLSEGLKLALATIPNVECVSLTLALFSAVFGSVGIVGAVVFVGLEAMIWGIAPWTLAYLIYFPMLAIVFCLLGKTGKTDKAYVPPLVIMLATLVFGILTSVVDLVIGGGIGVDFLERLGIYYLRGVVFYVVHIVSNGIIFALLFAPLKKVMQKYLPDSVRKTAK